VACRSIARIGRAPFRRLELETASARSQLATASRQIARHAALLDRGEFDLAIGTFEDAGERFAAAPLLEDSFVVAMRRDHPAAQGELTEEALAGLSYLEIRRASKQVFVSLTPFARLKPID